MTLIIFLFLLVHFFFSFTVWYHSNVHKVVVNPSVFTFVPILNGLSFFVLRFFLQWCVSTFVCMNGVLILCSPEFCRVLFVSCSVVFFFLRFSSSSFILTQAWQFYKYNAILWPLYVFYCCPSLIAAFFYFIDSVKASSCVYA